jgi:hypothetical protein
VPFSHGRAARRRSNLRRCYLWRYPARPEFPDEVSGDLAGASPPTPKLMLQCAIAGQPATIELPTNDEWGSWPTSRGGGLSFFYGAEGIVPGRPITRMNSEDPRYQPPAYLGAVVRVACQVAPEHLLLVSDAKIEHG